MAVSIDIGGVPEIDTDVRCTTKDLEVPLFRFCGTVKGRHSHCSKANYLSEGWWRGVLADTLTPVFPSFRVGYFEDILLGIVVREISSTGIN
jgi:hypothetical protein